MLADHTLYFFFDMKKAAEMRKAEAAGNADAAPVAEGLNEACIGKTYRAEARLITKEASKQIKKIGADLLEGLGIDSEKKE